jgi:hypothetical protein
MQMIMMMVMMKKMRRKKKENVDNSDDDAFMNRKAGANSAGRTLITEIERERERKRC